MILILTSRPHAARLADQGQAPRICRRGGSKTRPGAGTALAREGRGRGLGVRLGGSGGGCWGLEREGQVACLIELKV